MATKKQLKESFDMFDKNKSGTLTLEEIYKIFKSLGCKQTKSEVQEMIAAIDEDGEGEVDFPEFCQLFKKTIESKNGKPAKIISNLKPKKDIEEGPSEAELGVIDAINKFRKDPESYKDFIVNLVNGMKQLNNKDPMIKEYNVLRRELHTFPKNMPEVTYSPELSAAAKTYLEKCKNNAPKNKILYKEECKGIVPSNFLQEDSFTYVTFHDTFNTPDFTVVKMLSDTDDTDKWGKAFLNSDLITQIGVAVEEGDTDNSYCVVILDDDAAVVDDWQPDFDDSDLRNAFDALDYEGKNRLNIKEILKYAHTGFEDSYPTLINMLKELDKGKEDQKVYITYPEFAQHFHNRLQHIEDDKKRAQEIFNVFLAKEKDVQSVNEDQLQKIAKQIGIEKDWDDEKIRQMLQMNTKNKYGVDLDEYLERLEIEKNHPEGE